MTEIDNKVFIVFGQFHKSSNIEVYDAHTFKQLSVIKVEGLSEPRDIVACCQDHQLYVAEDYCIWRVSADDQSFVKWLTIESTADTVKVNKLSLTSRRLLVTPQKSPTLRQYNTVDCQPRVVQLPEYVRDIYHAVETGRETFVVCHRGTSQNVEQDAVSELIRVRRLISTALNLAPFRSYCRSNLHFPPCLGTFI